MTRHAIATRRAILVMSMRGKSSRTRSVSPPGRMAIQTNLVGRLAQLRVIIRAMHVVAVIAGNAAPVHHALRKIVSLHSILVRRPIRKMRKTQLAQRMLLQLPVIAQRKPHVISNRPIVIFSFNWIGQWPSLRMALDAGIVAAHIIHPRGI